MGEKFWIQDFETRTDRLRIHFITKDGEVESIIVVQYEAFIDGQWRPVVRFDEAHGFFHRDIILPGTEQQKTALSGHDKGLALTEAITEIKQQWQAYRKAYEAKYYGKV